MQIVFVLIAFHDRVQKSLSPTHSRPQHEKNTGKNTGKNTSKNTGRILIKYWLML